MTNHPNRKLPRYEVLSSGYDTIPVFGRPGDIGAGYDKPKFISAHDTRVEAEAACADARRPSEVIHGTNSTWQTREDAYVRDRKANR
jgi:hypothetical protein